MNATLNYPLKHTVKFRPDDGQPITFRWHLPRGTLEPRMSGLELMKVLGQHLPGVLPFLLDHDGNRTRAYDEMEIMITMLLTSPLSVIDEVLPWIRSVTRTQEYDIVQLSLFDKTPLPERKLYFV